MTRLVDSIVMSVAVACAVLTTGLVVRRELAPSPDAARVQGRRIKEWRQLADAQVAMGSPAAPTTIVEFFDFQCPACRRMSYTLDSIMRSDESGIRLVHRNLPLREIHPRAYELALGGICAAGSGVFETYYRRAFDRQAEVSSAGVDIATLLPRGADTGTFRRCLEDSAGGGGSGYRRGALDPDHDDSELPRERSPVCRCSHCGSA